MEQQAESGRRPFGGQLRLAAVAAGREGGRGGLGARRDDCAAVPLELLATLAVMGRQVDRLKRVLELAVGEVMGPSRTVYKSTGISFVPLTLVNQSSRTQ